MNSSPSKQINDSVVPITNQFGTLISKPYNTENVVKFYSKSRDIKDLNVGDINWRQYISNFTPSIIYINGKKYPSIEHAFQAGKYILGGFPSNQFEVNGDIKTAKDAKSAGSKKGMNKKYKLTTDQLHEWNTTHAKTIMMQALIYRFNHDEEFKRILLATKGRYLLHFERSGEKSIWGGSIKNNVIQGENMLGNMMMNIRDIDE